MVFGIDISKIVEDESSEEEISQLLKRFEEKGYDFFPSWTMDEPETPDRIQMPSGNILDEYELDNWFKDKKIAESFVFEDKTQTEVLGAREFYYLIRCLDAGERYDRYTQSFIDEKDIENCKRKYSKCQT